MTGSENAAGGHSVTPREESCRVRPRSIDGIETLA
jgi:hypothetical protein